MRSELFEYDLPPERIAQTPLEPRDAARLLHVQLDGALHHLSFRNLPALLNPGDLLVFNDTRVLPARLRGRKLNPGVGEEASEGAKVEALLLRRLDAARWEALVHPGRRLRVGARIAFGAGELMAEVLAHGEEGARVLAFSALDGDPDAAIHRLGRAPLPPYIHARLEDEERYQTVYARPEHEGSAAAPTAGLHFTPRVFEALRERGVETAYVTLHVGLATFRPIKAETIEGHEMHAEWYCVPPETADALAACRARGGRVVAVGTTTVRCLESWALAVGQERSGGEERLPQAEHGSGTVHSPLPSEGRGARGVSSGETPPPAPPPRGEGSLPLTVGGPAAVGSPFPRREGGWGVRSEQLPTSPEKAADGFRPTRLYVTPGFRFQVVDALLTNFHMPRSSLLVLVSAFAGYETIRAAYAEALAREYRFLSFGDAMLLLREAG